MALSRKEKEAMRNPKSPKIEDFEYFGNTNEAIEVLLAEVKALKKRKPDVRIVAEIARLSDELVDLEKAMAEQLEEKPDKAPKEEEVHNEKD